MFVRRCFTCLFVQIRFLLVQNKAGKMRLAKWYVPYEDEEQEKIQADIARLTSSRDAKFTNFIEVCCIRGVCVLF